MATPTVSRQDTRSLWLGALAGPITWSVYFMIGYLLVEVVCNSDFLDFSLFGMAAISALIIALTVVGLGVTIYAGFINYQKWRQPSEEDELDFGEQLGNKPARFMALSGLLLCGLFTLVILLTGIPAFVLRPC